MKRLTIPGSGTESRATKPARVSAPATLGGAAFGASREDTEIGRASCRERVFRVV